jgi:hypothetical protein
MAFGGPTMIFLVIGGEGALLRDILAATPMLQGVLFDLVFNSQKLKRVEIAQLAAFHRLTSNGLLRLKNNVYNLVFTGW